MSDQLLTAPRPVIPVEVHDFAAEKEVSRYLSPVVDLAQRAFPASALRVSIGQDAEDEAHQYIALDVDVSGLTADELLSRQRNWSAGMNFTCPSRYAVHFVLGWR